MKRLLSLLLIGGVANAQSPVMIPNTESLTLGDYALSINLPAGYPEPGRTYPVIYVLDGQWDFSLVSALYGQECYDGFVPDAITVGVSWGGPHPDYDALRARDFTPSSPDGSARWGAAPSFLSFIRTQLIPFIDTRYHTQRAERTLTGSSLGGLFTLYTLFNAPDLFDRYIASSPALQWDKGSLQTSEQAFLKTGPGHPVRLFLAVGSLEPMAAGVKAFADSLSGRGVRGLRLELKIADGMGHSGTKAEGYSRGLQFAFDGDHMRNVTLTSTTASPMMGQALDTLRAQVVHLGNSFQGITSGTVLNVRTGTLPPGAMSGVSPGAADELIIVKEGNLEVRLNQGMPKPLGPGGLALLVREDQLTFRNTGDVPATYYALIFLPLQPQQGATPGLSTVCDWPDLPIQTTPKGETRQIFSEPTTRLTKIDMHATTLNAGEVSHAPHTHPQTEIILMRSGQVEMQIGDKFYPAQTGDLILLTSETPHALKNTGATPAQYYALQWQ